MNGYVNGKDVLEWMLGDGRRGFGLKIFIA